MTLEEAAAKLKLEIKGSFTIGIAAKCETNPEDHLVVYWHERPTRLLPETYEGFKLYSRYVGKIKVN